MKSSNHFNLPILFSITVITAVATGAWYVATVHKEVELQNTRITALERANEIQDANNVRFQDQINEQLIRMEGKVDKVLFVINNTKGNE